jgi:Fe-S-cluster-containing hydrogenase component 2
LACGLANFDLMTLSRAALRVEALFPSPGRYHVHLCDQCGDCAEACPVDAIEWDGKAYVVREDECTECGSCFDVCPHGVVLSGPANDVPIKCTNCGECAAICPRGAIEAVGDQPLEAAS